MRPRIGRCGGNIFRQVEVDGAGRLSHGQRQSLLDGGGDASGGELVACLGERPEDGLVIDAHLDATRKLRAGYLASNGQHRRSVQKGIADAGRKIGRPRPNGRHGYARHAGDAADDVGHEAGGALMADQDEIDTGTTHSVDDGQDLAAGDANGMAYAGGVELAGDEVGVGGVRGVEATMCMR